ncbi:hypothetical protein [Janibacter melonis]|uniref:hypothetical protein n=1 Tax=Janibacter melonis TaxID=262209 RepID=UPI002094DBBE|nr:hypothetical protein [Janibacter melonis]
MTPVDRTRLRALLQTETAAYAAANPRSRALHEEGTNLFGQVPMTWMRMWAGGFPLGFEAAKGNRVTDLDGHELADLALGDTGAMAGHSPTRRSRRSGAAPRTSAG